MKSIGPLLHLRICEMFKYNMTLSWEDSIIDLYKCIRTFVSDSSIAYELSMLSDCLISEAIQPPNWINTHPHSYDWNLLFLKPFIDLINNLIPLLTIKN